MWAGLGDEVVPNLISFTLIVRMRLIYLFEYNGNELHDESLCSNIICIRCGDDDFNLMCKIVFIVRPIFMPKLSHIKLIAFFMANFNE